MKSIIIKITLALTIIILTSQVNASQTFYSFLEKAEINNTYKTTNCTAIKYNKAITVEYVLDEESYVNDIPFNTDSISDEYNYLNAVSKSFEMDEESYINDIPFNTKKIVREFND